jgi:hypothetical protein
MGHWVSPTGHADWHKLHITAVQSSGTVCNLSDIERTGSADGRADAAWICRVLANVRAKERDVDAMQCPPLPEGQKSRDQTMRLMSRAKSYRRSLPELAQ